MKIKLVFGILLWIPAAVLRFILYVVGWVAVGASVLGKGYMNTPWLWRIWADAKEVRKRGAFKDASRWKMYVEMAWRNPTMGLRGLWKQPLPEIHPNPDKTVRSGQKRKDSRWMQSGLYWEYWSLSAMKDGRFLEFRIGWKFVDGQETFYPTLQLGPKK